MLADCLSRLEFQKDTISLPKLHVNQISSQLKARSNSLHNLQIAKQDDDKVTILKHIIQQGWAKTIKEVPSEIQPYWTFCEELTIEDRLVLKGTRIIIPVNKREEIMKLIHESHLGLNKCKISANETMYWPGINEHLEQLILKLPTLLEVFKIKR